MNDDFGQRLRDLRYKRGETLEQVAAATRLSIAMLSRIERGERMPSPESVEVLAKHFGMPLDEMMSATIVQRMLTRYGPESSQHAARRMSGPRESYEAETPSEMRLASAPAGPTRSVAFNERPIEDLFGEAATLDTLFNAAHVAEVAIDSALSAAQRALASDNPEVQSQGRYTLERLHRKLDEAL